jgi:hypothetical protein
MFFVDNLLSGKISKKQAKTQARSNRIIEYSAVGKKIVLLQQNRIWKSGLRI